jgi:hypothetical protein
MKARILKTMLGAGFAALIIAAFAACPNPEDSRPNAQTPPSDYNDTPVTSFAGTKWSDFLIPESTIEFLNGTNVQMEGRYWKKYTEVNGAQKEVDLSGVKAYDAVAALNAAKVEPAVYVYMDAAKHTGYEFYYYQADPATGKHQRLVVWINNGILQPREFYLPVD